MNQHETAEPVRTEKPDLRSFLVAEAPAIAGMVSALIAYAFEDVLFADLNNYPLTILLFIWLFGTMMWCAFGVVRHADAVAVRLGEPYGTLVLTLSVIVIEVSLLAAIMLHGANNPTLAGDAMFATLMIVLNGMVGAALLMGALRYWEQEYNLEGARAFLVVIASLAVFALIIPNYTKTEPDPSQAPFKAVLFAAITILFYRRHSDDATPGLLRRAQTQRAPYPAPGASPRVPKRIACLSRADARAHPSSSRAALRVPRHRFRHRGSRVAGTARRRDDRHPRALARGAHRLPRRAR